MVSIVFDSAPDAWFAEGIDKLWMVVALLMPWVKAVLEVRNPNFLPKHLEQLDLSFGDPAHQEPPASARSAEAKA